MNTSYKNKSIMIVDDSEFSKKTMAKILKDNGFNVKAEAGSAEEAISILKNIHCDLFIIDIVMPETSGLELAKIIKESTSDPKIIMISSLAEETIIMDAI
ncbi:MAG: response regulator, partial [Bdellovibrionales bacterium]|nr:response regulator [Bdellovibrionales bacterium]